MKASFGHRYYKYCLQEPPELRCFVNFYDYLLLFIMIYNACFMFMICFFLCLLFEVHTGSK